MKKSPPLPSPVFILPGIANSGPEHWQSRWEEGNPSFIRVQQREWDSPVCAEWLAVLEEAVAGAVAPPLLVAHSLACLLVAHWAERTQLQIRGALLVAPPDPAHPNFPKAARGFAPVPQHRLPFPSLLVASSNDPYADLAFAERCAAHWGSRFVNAGALGHINAASNLGEWREGFALFRQLRNESR